MAYQKIESHDEYLKIVEKYKDYKAGTRAITSVKPQFRVSQILI